MVDMPIDVCGNVTLRFWNGVCFEVDNNVMGKKCGKGLYEKKFNGLFYLVLEMNFTSGLRPDSPIPYNLLFSDISEIDDEAYDPSGDDLLIDNEDDFFKDVDCDKYELEEEVDEELEAANNLVNNNSDNDDEELVIARQRVRPCNSHLDHLLKNLKKDDAKKRLVGDDNVVGNGRMASKNENNASVRTSASNTPIALDDDESPVETDSDPYVLPITSRHTSAVWSDFKRKRVGDVVKAECNHCSKLFAGGSKAGTTHLKHHLKICPKRACQDLRQTRMLDTKKNLNDKNDTMTLAPYEFHQEDGRRDLAEMIILHEYPISMVEHMGFRKYSKTLQPGFKVPSRNTTRKDIMKRYELEKENVATLLRKAKGKIALTTDMWTADNQRKGYMAVTSHFIDNTWKLQSRIIRFLYVPAPHTAEVLADALKERIQSWNLDLRLSSITVDNCSTNDAMMEILKGDFFHMRCCAHILNLIIQDGLSVVVSNGVQRIRDSVVFWTASDKRVQRFEQVAKQMAPECSRKLALDCKTRWNSTYEMLSIAISYKEVFVVLSAHCGEFKDDEYAKLVGELEEGFETWDIDSGTSGVCTE
uniref:BED-type domain-containing protein n=1 Tax=Chenopodium quinoa TaxID=63459 RepID=A0A803LZ45_CHEQI